MLAQVRVITCVLNMACHIDRNPPKIFKHVLNKITGKEIKASANVLRHLFECKSLYQHLTIACDLETMFAK